MNNDHNRLKSLPNAQRSHAEKVAWTAKATWPELCYPALHSRLLTQADGMGTRVHGLAGPYEVIFAEHFDGRWLRISVLIPGSEPLEVYHRKETNRIYKDSSKSGNQIELVDGPWMADLESQFEGIRKRLICIADEYLAAHELHLAKLKADHEDRVRLAAALFVGRTEQAAERAKGSGQ